MKEKMKAMVIHSPGDYGIEEVSVPECPERGLLIKQVDCTKLSKNE